MDIRNSSIHFVCGISKKRQIQTYSHICHNVGTHYLPVFCGIHCVVYICTYSKGLEYFPSNIYTSDLGAARPDPKKDKKLQPAEVPNVYLPAKIDLGDLDKLDLK